MFIVGPPSMRVSGEASRSLRPQLPAQLNVAEFVSCVHDIDIMHQLKHTTAITRSYVTGTMYNNYTSGEVPVAWGSAQGKAVERFQPQICPPKRKILKLPKKTL